MRTILRIYTALGLRVDI